MKKRMENQGSNQANFHKILQNKERHFSKKLLSFKNFVRFVVDFKMDFPNFTK